MQYLIGLLLIANVSFGQKQGNVWIFGQGGGLDFNSGTPVVLTGSQIFGNPTISGDYLYSEGCASISDSSGALLFYSNGEKVWNKNNIVMPNGDSLKGFYSSTSAAFIIPMPLSDSLYYLFTTDGIERDLQKGLRYSLVDMCLDGGNGDVISTHKNILLLDTVAEKLCAIAHPNGTDVWLIAHKHFSDAFYAYKITPTGINTPVISNIGRIHTGGGLHGGCGSSIGQMKASSDGTRIGLAFANVSPEDVEVFDFDVLTGMISNPLSLTYNSGNYGVEFSPDNTKFYLTGVNGIFQFDLTAGGGTQTAINASRTLITNALCLPGPLQLGPDGKIYAARCNNMLGVINSPNSLGTLCNYVNAAINISPCVSNTSLPAFIAGYNYKNNKLPRCLSTGINEQLDLNIYKIYPNPTNQSATLEFNNLAKRNCTLALYDTFGRLMQTTNIMADKVEIERNNLPNGLYFFKLSNDKQIIATGKLIIE